MPTANFPNVISGDLTFTNITVNEVDTGLTSNDTTFIGHSGLLGPGDLLGHNGLHWLAFNAELTGDGVGSVGSSIQLTFSYDVTATGTNVITGFDQLIQTDFQNGTGISASAIETITDDNNNVVGIGTWTPGSGAPLIMLAQGYQHLHVSLAFTESVAADSTGQIGISILTNGFTEGPPPPPLAALGDYVWLDTNNNGIQDEVGTGISGVTVELEDTTGNILSTTTTDASGAYHFTGLAPGSYEVQFIAPAGDAFSAALQGGNTATDSNPDVSTGVTAPITLVAGQTDNTIDAGLHYLPAALGDYVWLDTNNNGIQDEVGTGISGVTVELEDTTGNILSTTTTDASGAYHFTGLAPGSYKVQFIAPTGDAFSAALQGGDTATNSNPNVSTGVTAPITLVAGQTDNTIDAGLHYLPAALGDYVWLDTNNNGIQDEVGTGISGVTVELEDTTGNILSITTTDASGAYHFTGLAPGSYEVQFIAPTGDTFSAALQGGNTTEDSNPNVSTGVTAPVTLVAGQTDNTIDAGLHYLPAALGDYVWLDTNNNGIQDEVGTGISGVTVELEDTTGNILSITTTDASGAYHFTGLAPGSYEVQFIAPAGDAFSAALQGGNTAKDSNPNVSTGVTAPITLVAGQTDNTIDAGLHYLPAALGDYVWLDTNNNGIQDEVGTGISGVTVELENISGGVISTTTTDASGAYHFTGLAPGSYEVQFIAPAGDAFSAALQGGNTAKDSNPNVSTGVTAPITLVAGQTDNTIDAGLHYLPAALGDYVWLDANANGIQDSGEAGVSGVTVELENTSGAILSTTTTDANGLYHFTGLAPGSYEVQFVAPTGNAFTLATQGGNTAVDSNANQSTGQTAPVTLVAGQTDNTIDAGLVLQSGGGSGGPPPGITVIKLPCQVVVGTCGQVTYTYDVINTGSVPVSGINVVDNIGTAAKPNNVTPNAVTSNGYNVGDGNHNGVLDPGETWVYQNTINEAGNYNSKSSSAHCSVSGQNLGGGCTTWFNSSFTPTSCKDGATYTFQNITCTVSGPGCGTFTECVPNAVVTFSNSCSQATTTYDSSQNCWVTTLPANCNPGDVFLSGLPWQVPNGCNLSGATVTWNIGQSANNCGSSSVNWQVGCQGYSDFGQNGCDGNDDYNQIGVKACDNQSGYGNGGSTDWGYGYNNGGSGGYCNYGWGSGGSSWGGWSGWDGSDNDCAGTPENQYTTSNCGSYGGGCGGWGYGGGGGYCGSGGGYNDGGICGNGSGSGSCSQGQLCNSPEADTVTVTATTLGQGFSLGDAGNYGIIAFNPTKFVGSSTGAINGNVGLGVSCGSTTVQLNGEKITGNLVATGTKPSSTGGTVTGSITGNSATLAADINALKALSTLLAGEAGTSIALTSGMVIQASNGTFDAMGDEVFKITKWANNITINGDGTHNVVLDFASGIIPNLDNVTLTGGLTPGEVLFNYTGTSTISGTSGNTFNASLLAPNAVFNVSTNVTVNGDLFGGASGQAFTFNGGSKLFDPATGSGGPPTTTTTVTASDSKEVEVLCSNSNISVNGSTPTGSLSQLYGKASTLEFSYSPSDTVHVGTANIGSSTGHNADSLAFIEISNKSTPFASGAQIYFQGEVITGEKIFADATLNQLTNTPVAAPNNVFSTTPGADIYMYVFHSQSDFQNHVAPIQSEWYNTSGSQAMHFNDQIGSLKVIGYIGATGGHLVS